jgi:hypothetical protein
MDYVWINLAYFALAIIALFVILRVLDALNGRQFREDTLPIIEKSPMAVAVYRGSWVIGGCMLLGSMLGIG